MQTVLNILVILSLALQNIFIPLWGSSTALRPVAASVQPQGNSNVVSVLPDPKKGQAADPGTEVPAPVEEPIASETPTGSEVPADTETATPDISTVQPSETPVPPDPATPETKDPQPPVDVTPTTESPIDVLPGPTEKATVTPEVPTATPTATPTGSPTTPVKSLPPAKISLSDEQPTFLVDL
jgi:hypothetical protein